MRRVSPKTPSKIESNITPEMLHIFPSKRAEVLIIRSRPSARVQSEILRCSATRALLLYSASFAFISFAHLLRI